MHVILKSIKTIAISMHLCICKPVKIKHFKDKTYLNFIK